MSNPSRFPALLRARLPDSTAAGIVYHIGGALVPVLAVDLAPGQAVCFERHILPWKAPWVQMETRFTGMAARFPGGMSNGLAGKE